MGTNVGGWQNDCALAQVAAGPASAEASKSRKEGRQASAPRSGRTLQRRGMIARAPSEMPVDAINSIAQ